jgi:hypothetical protein
MTLRGNLKKIGIASWMVLLSVLVAASPVTCFNKSPQQAEKLCCAKHHCNPTKTPQSDCCKTKLFSGHTFTVESKAQLSSSPGAAVFLQSGVTSQIFVARPFMAYIAQRVHAPPLERYVLLSSFLI